MAWVDWDDLTFLSQRTDADNYSAADMNSVNANIKQVRDNLIIALGSYGQPTRDLATIDEDLTTLDGDLSTLDGRVTDAENDIDDLQASIGFIPKFITGLTLSNATGDANNDITIAAGSTNDSTNAYVLTLASAMTKQLDATWAAGTNAGGLFSGSKANNTWYHVFLIRKTSNGTIDAGFDTSLTAANIPSGYGAYRYIGSIQTNSSGNIKAFFQVGDMFHWTTPTLDASPNLTSTASLITLQTPIDIQCFAYINVDVNTVGTYYYYLSCPSQTDSAPSTSAAPLYSGMTNSSIDAQHMVLTDTSSRIRGRTNYKSNIAFNFRTTGYRNLYL